MTALTVTEGRASFRSKDRGTTLTEEGKALLARIDRAYKRMEALVAHKYQPVIRIATGKRKLKVLIHPTSSSTDGETMVYLRLPLELGDADADNHNKAVCGSRDEAGSQLCPACRLLEEIDQVIWHESFHMVFESFIEPDDSAKRAAAAALASERGVPEDLIDGATSAMQVAGYLNKWLPDLVNVIEDVYVNEAGYKARKGLRTAAVARYRRTFTSQNLSIDGSFWTWPELPVTARVMILFLAMGQGCEAEARIVGGEDAGFLVDDPDVKSIVSRIHGATKTGERLLLAVEALEVLRSHGFLFDERHDTRPAEEDEDGEEAVLTDDPSDQEVQTKEGKPDDDSEPEEDADKDDDESSTSDEDDEPDLTEASDDAESDEGESVDDDDEDDEEDSEEDDDFDDDFDDDDEDDLEEDDGDDEEDEPASDGEPCEEGEPTDDGEDAGSEDDGENEAEAEENGDDGASDDDGFSDDDSEGDSGESGEGFGDGEGVDSNEDFDEDDLDEGEGDEGESTEGEAGHRSDADTGGEGTDASDDLDDGEPTEGDDDEGHRGETDKGDPVEFKGTDDSEEEVESALESAMGHGDFSKDREDEDLPPEEAEEREVVEVALSQRGMFDEPTFNLKGGVTFTKPRARAGADTTQVPPGILSGPTAQLRIAMAENRKIGIERSLKRGPRLDTAHLYRLLTDDDRLHAKRSIPKKRDWAVVVGLDLSGSTMGGRNAIIRAGGIAVGDMLSSLGIKFTVLGHSGTPTTVTMKVGKEFHEPWNQDARSRVDAMGADAANYDGHSVEVYRRLVEAQPATDKLILYFTDGAMPCENYGEELEILQKNILMCRRSKINLVGVGVLNTEPRDHGLDTIRFDGFTGQYGLAQLVEELGKRLKVA